MGTAQIGKTIRPLSGDLGAAIANEIIKQRSEALGELFALCTAGTDPDLAKAAQIIIALGLEPQDVRGIQALTAHRASCQVMIDWEAAHQIDTFGLQQKIREAKEWQEQEVQRIRQEAEAKINPLATKIAQAHARATGAAEARRLRDSLSDFDRRITNCEVEQAREVLREAARTPIVDYAPYCSD